MLLHCSDGKSEVHDVVAKDFKNNSTRGMAVRQEWMWLNDAIKQFSAAQQ